MMQTLKTIRKENVVSIKELQKSPSRHLKNITRILRGNKTFGYFIDQPAFDDLLEDLEAASSAKYIASIKNARARQKRYSLADVKKRYGV